MTIPAGETDDEDGAAAMCLAVPGKILDISDDGPLTMAHVDFGGVTKKICLAYLPDARVGEYVIVHVGFAIQRLDEASALATLELFGSAGLLEEEFGDPWTASAGSLPDLHPPVTPATPASVPEPATAAPEPMSGGGA